MDNAFPCKWQNKNKKGTQRDGTEKNEANKGLERGDEP